VNNRGLETRAAARTLCGHLGLRWQAKRDTAFARTGRIEISTPRPLKSAVAAGALPAQSKTLCSIHYVGASGISSFLITTPGITLGFRS